MVVEVMVGEGWEEVVKDLGAEMVVEALVGEGWEEVGRPGSSTRPCSASTPWRQGFQNGGRSLQRSRRIRR